MSELPVLTATYRLQFHRDFTFADARRLVPYLHQLGISYLYASPLFAAHQGSSHGYDVIDPSHLNPELGTEADFEALVVELQAHRMGLLLDIVPNHMAASTENPWWADLLENGLASPYASYFDVDWSAGGEFPGSRVRLPLLGKPFHEILEGGDLTLVLDQEEFKVAYFDRRLAVEGKSYELILAEVLTYFRRGAAADPESIGQLEQLIGELDRLPEYYATDFQNRQARQESIGAIKGGLQQLVNSSPAVQRALEDTLVQFNGQVGEIDSFARLERLLVRQPYQLAFWKTGVETINYRRFFDIADLVGVRVELPEVLEATHALIWRLVETGKVSGLRIDHIDGLYDPSGYLEQLQQRLAGARASASGSPGFYLLVEKILGSDEQLPDEWPVAGTTGYEFLNALNAVFVDPVGVARLVDTYHQFIGDTTSFADVVYANQRRVLTVSFPSEIRSLADTLCRLAWQDRYACDLPVPQLTEALIEVTACLPVYRTYARNGAMGEADRRQLRRAIGEAIRRTPTLDQRATDFLERMISGDWPEWLSAQQREERQQFVSRWQQFTGPVMAKGLEDTSLYAYNPLVSLNEVGGHLASEHMSVASLHRHNTARQARWSYSMSATSTHDTKRSEDVRARINVLSELPDEWSRRVNRWHRWNQGYRQTVAGDDLPDRGTEVLLYQTLLGAWPLVEEEVPRFKERLEEYLVKAVREADIHSSWIAPDLDYEQALMGFGRAILRDAPENRFLPDFLRIQRRIAYFGALNSLAQVLLKATSPGVPDIYQGNELWDLSLVDPDNRRPVDFAQRRSILDSWSGMSGIGLRERISWCRDMLASWPDGRVKLHVTHRSLQARREHPDLFRDGEYLPLDAVGDRAEHVFAFARRTGSDWGLVVAPRCFSRLTRAGSPPLGRRTWGEDTLRLLEDAPRTWRSAFTGETIRLTSDQGQVPLATLLRYFPVALLLGES